MRVFPLNTQKKVKIPNKWERSSLIHPLSDSMKYELWDLTRHKQPLLPTYEDGI
jgi:hypothetical protein